VARGAAFRAHAIREGSGAAAIGLRWRAVEAQLTSGTHCAFRLKHLDDPRARDVIQLAARRFGWQPRTRQGGLARGAHGGIGGANGAVSANGLIETCGPATARNRRPIGTLVGTISLQRSVSSFDAAGHARFAAPATRDCYRVSSDHTKATTVRRATCRARSTRRGAT
jgi:hypothetical protein